MNHDHTPIDRTSFWYWVSGDGAWSNRWECTSHDAWLAGFTILSASLMLALYVMYALQSHAALSVIRESHYRRHLRELRNVFLLCGTVHAVNSLLCWVLPVYWLSVLLMIVNSWQTYLLVKSKSVVLAIQHVTDGDDAAAQVENALEVIQRRKTEEVRQLLADVESSLRRVRSDDGERI